jgi:anti-anti-sigma factor
MDMDINVYDVQNTLVVDVGGRVNSVTAITLGEQLVAASKKNKHNIVLDLSDVEYVTSAGLREIMSGLDRAKKGGGDLRLATPSARVTELLGLTGFDHHIAIFATLDEAVQSFA